MLNTSGMLAVMDHHVTLNWDDGPTLMRISAQVRYRLGAFGTAHTLRVNASSRCGDEPLCFNARANGVQLGATWTWFERDGAFGAQLAISNAEPDDDIVIEACDVVRLDAAYNAQFNLGAPSGLWRVADDAAAARGRWTSLDGAEQLAFVGSLIVQPSASNRSQPPGLRFAAGTTSAQPVQFELQATPERFERFSALVVVDAPLAPGVTVVSPEVWIVSGDDARELARFG